MNNVVVLNESANLYSRKKDLTSEEYKSNISSVKSMDTSDIDDLREQNDNLIKFLEGTHYAHDKYRTELTQLKENISDLQLDLDDERIESKQLREKLFSASETPESLKETTNEARPVSTTAKLEEANQQLMIRLLASEKKHAETRQKMAISKQEMLRQIQELKLKLGSKNKLSASDQSEVSAYSWEKVSMKLPSKSGIYLLTDGINQCVGYFNFEHGEFAKNTYFSIPTHWMTRPDLPKQ
jgi:septin family protein